MQSISPLRYPGGKARLAGFIQALLQSNKLYDGQYVEPYAGGASVALSLLVNECVSHVYINDLDRSVYAFWYSALHKTEALCRYIRDAELSITEWKRQRYFQRRPANIGLLRLGFSTLYLNRTNRSGIIQSGGAIGGTKQQGEWKLDARFYRETLIRRIQTIAAYRDRITLSNLDAAAFLKGLLPKLPLKTLIYLDPPYYVKGKRRLYANFYEHLDHSAIANMLAGCRHPWLVSYDNVSQTRALYRRYRHRKYGLPYTAHNRYKGAEVIFFSDNLALPTTPIVVPTRP
jgi:DNA adenine methylase